LTISRRGIRFGLTEFSTLWFALCATRRGFERFFLVENVVVALRAAECAHARDQRADASRASAS
jgi:hypothetical protein